MPNEMILKSGLRLYFEDFGTGLPVICVPGWSCTTAVFERNLPELSKQYRVISFDPRSHGRSAVTVDGNDYGQHGRDLRDFLDELGLQEFVLLGWSLGLYTIYSYIEQFGTENIKGLVAVDESPQIIKSHADDWGEGMAEEVNGVVNMVRSNYQGFFREYMAEGFINPPSDDLLDRFTLATGSLSPVMAAGLLADAATRDYSRVASEIAAEFPVLNILREDWSLQAQTWISLNQPAAAVKVLGGHLMLYEFAEKFNAHVFNFLADLRYH